jgi:hypothetical protein
MERPRQSIAARLFGISVVSLLLLLLFTVTHPGFNVVRNIFHCYNVGIFFGHRDYKSTYVRCRFQQP